MEYHSTNVIIANSTSSRSEQASVAKLSVIKLSQSNQSIQVLYHRHFIPHLVIKTLLGYSPQYTAENRLGLAKYDKSVIRPYISSVSTTSYGGGSKGSQYQLT